MSITGEPDGRPLKHGMAITDLVTGMNATQAILAALIARGRSGQGQFLDIALLDGAVALLANVGTGYLNAGGRPRKYGNAHPTVVPYQTFETRLGRFVLACGNDGQYRALCRVLERPELGEDPRFTRNADRVGNRAVLIPLLEEAFRQEAADVWLERLWAAKVPAGVIHDVPEAFAAPAVQGRHLVDTVPHPALGEVHLIRSPLRLSETPVSAPTAPPMLGADTAEVLSRVLGKSPSEIAALSACGAIRLAS